MFVSLVFPTYPLAWVWVSCDLHGQGFIAAPSINLTGNRSDLFTIGRLAEHLCGGIRGESLTVESGAACLQVCRTRGSMDRRGVDAQCSTKSRVTLSLLANLAARIRAGTFWAVVKLALPDRGPCTRVDAMAAVVRSPIKSASSSTSRRLW